MGTTTLYRRGRTMLREHVQQCYGLMMDAFMARCPLARQLKADLAPEAWDALQEVQEETFAVHATASGAGSAR